MRGVVKPFEETVEGWARGMSATLAGSEALVLRDRILELDWGISLGPLVFGVHQCSAVLLAGTYGWRGIIWDLLHDCHVGDSILYVVVSVV